MGAEVLLLTVAFGFPTAIVIVGLGRQASRRRQGALTTAMDTRADRGLPLRAASSLVISLMFAAASVFFVWGLGLSPWLVAVYADGVILPFALMSIRQRRADGKLGTLGRGEALCLMLAAVLLGATVATRALRNDHLPSVPAVAAPVRSCPASAVVPDVGNELNSSVAGSSSVAAVGTKLYVTDAPSSSGIRLEGATSVCDVGRSSFGEALIAVSPGTTTLYVTTADGDIYRVRVRVTER